MATLPRVPTGNNKQYTLDSQAAAGASSITLNQSVSGVVRAPGYCVIDRIDSSSNLTPTKREYKYFTGVSGAQLTGVTSVDGTDQVHAVGAIVEFVPDVKYEQDWYDWGITDHTTSGAHVSLVSLAVIKTGDFFGASAASLQLLNVIGRINVSGASITGVPIHPVWVFTTPSAASAGLGSPLPMPEAGMIEWASVTLSGPVSGASLVLDVNNGITSIFTDQNTRLTVLGGGTYASTASIGTKAFSKNAMLSVDQDTALNTVKATVVIRAR